MLFLNSVVDPADDGRREDRPWFHCALSVWSSRHCSRGGELSWAVLSSFQVPQFHRCLNIRLKGNRGDLPIPLEIAELSNFLETPPFLLILDHRGQLGLISFITFVGFIGAQVSYRLSLWHNSSEEKTMTRLVDGSEIYHFHQWSLLVHPIVTDI